MAPPHIPKLIQLNNSAMLKLEIAVVKRVSCGNDCAEALKDSVQEKYDETKNEIIARVAANGLLR